jgi:hypothetical protein
VTGQSSATGGGEETAVSGYAHVDEIKIGEAVIKDQEVFVLQLHPDAVEGFPGSGMIGLGIFCRFVTNIDYGKKTLTLIKPPAFQPPKDAVAIKFTIYDNIPQVDGSFEGLPGKFDIDTGSREEVNFTTPFVNRNSLREKSKGVIATNGWGAGGRVQSYVTRGSDLQFGGVTIKNVVASLAMQKKGAFSDPNFAGNVGSGLLKRFDVTFDYRNRVMYLKRLPEPVADTDVFDRSGMWINGENGSFQVMSLTSGGPAENAGIKVGDMITAVDGVPVESSNLSEFRMKLRDEPPGTVVHLTIKNTGGSGVIALTLRDQI